MGARGEGNTLSLELDRHWAGGGLEGIVSAQAGLRRRLASGRWSLSPLVSSGVVVVRAAVGEAVEGGTGEAFAAEDFGPVLEG